MQDNGIITPQDKEKYAQEVERYRETNVLTKEQLEEKKELYKKHKEDPSLSIPYIEYEITVDMKIDPYETLFNTTLFMHGCMLKLYNDMTDKVSSHYIDELMWIYLELGESLKNCMPDGMRMTREFEEIINSLDEKYRAKKNKEAARICYDHAQEIAKAELYLVKEM